MSLKHHFLVVLLFSVLIAPAAQAHRKTDVVTLYNGDRITGEVKSLFGGILEFGTDAMGTIKIEWQEIARLESQYHYEIRVTDGERYYGSFRNTERAGQLVIKDIYGEHDVEWLAVVEIRPVEEKLTDRLDIYLSAGYSYTKASSVGTTTLNSQFSYEDERTRNTLNTRTVITDTDDTSTRSNKIDLARRVWTDREELFRILHGNYEQNDELSLDHRIVAGAGVGRYFIDTNRMRLSASAGIQGLTEKQFDADEEQSMEGFINLDFAVWRFDSPELDLTVGANVFPSLTESGRVRADTDIRIRWELVEDLFWDITAYGSFDNRAGDDQEFDYGITTGIGWEY